LQINKIISTQQSYTFDKGHQHIRKQGGSCIAGIGTTENEIPNTFVDSHTNSTKQLAPTSTREYVS